MTTSDPNALPGREAGGHDPSVNVISMSGGVGIRASSNQGNDAGVHCHGVFRANLRRLAFDHLRGWLGRIMGRETIYPANFAGSRRRRWHQPFIKEASNAG